MIGPHQEHDAQDEEYIDNVKRILYFEKAARGVSKSARRGSTVVTSRIRAAAVACERSCRFTN
jgi:hypothetical protein